MHKPDYNYLIKLDSWSKKDAALIISGLDPEQYRDIRFTYKYLDFEKYPELIQVYKLYKLFLSIDFRQYREYQSNPIAYVVECKKREWPVPAELLNLAKKRYAKEQEIKTIKHENVDEQDTTGIEKDYLLKSLGVLVLLYVSKQKKSRLGDVKNINVSQVVNDVLQFLEDNEIKIYGLAKSTLSSRFSESIKVIQQCF